MRIPDLRTSFPAAPLSVWADAAGAKIEELGCGMKGGGAVIPGGKIIDCGPVGPLMMDLSPSC